MNKRLCLWWTCLPVLFAVSCSTLPSTRLHTVWADEAVASYQPERLLVIAVTEREGSQRLYEQKMADALGKEGVNALSVSAIRPDPGAIEKDALAQIAADREVDTVVLTRLISVDKDQIYTPPSTMTVPSRRYGGYYGHYYSMYEEVHMPGYYTDRVIVRLETNLYDVESEALIWSAQSETLDREPSDAIMDSAIQAIVDGLKAQGLIGP